MIWKNISKASQSPIEMFDTWILLKPSHTHFFFIWIIGNEDRGGMAELIMLIKSSKVPIICMCNDRNHQKIRSLANHCFDLRFYRPRPEQIRSAMMSICFKEKVKIEPSALTELIVGCNQDVRQTRSLFFSSKGSTAT